MEINQNTENTNRYSESIKKNQTDILELQSTVSGIRMDWMSLEADWRDTWVA